MAMDEDEQGFLRSVAADIVVRYDGGQKLDFDSFRLDLEEQLAIWWLLPSFVRSAIKKEKQYP